jgi:hypothetical protein
LRVALLSISSALAESEKEGLTMSFIDDAKENIVDGFEFAKDKAGDAAEFAKDKADDVSSFVKDALDGDEDDAPAAE